MTQKKGAFLQEGKGKTLYEVKADPSLVWLEFKDSLTAFNGKKKSAFKGKGALNRDTSSLIFRFLTEEGVANHWVKDVGSFGMICRRLEILPLEVVLRNRLAGSTARRFQFPEGRALSAPLVEFYYKKDALGDPFISTEQALAFGFVTGWSEINVLKKRALLVNQKLKAFFDSAGLELIDFKLEFGKLAGRKELLLADEISCDSCRLWDKTTGEKRDKDRFRQDLGKVEESYKIVRDLLLKSKGAKNDCGGA